MNRHESATTRERLEALAKFAALMERPDFQFGHWVSPPQRADGVRVMPYFRCGGEGAALIQVCYDMGWVLEGFDWPEWAQSPEAIQLRDDPPALDESTVEQLARLLTVLIRQDRFVEGAMDSAFESGLLGRILKRAAVLAAGPSPNPCQNG